ncbi:MAG: DMT family transporter [Thermodesulfovibrionales bacterium]
MGSLYIVSAILIWSSLGVVVRLSGVEVHVLIFYSALVSAVIQGALLSMRRYRARVPRDGRSIIYLVLLGPLMLLNVASFFYAYQNTTIAKAILAHYIAPVLVAFLAAVFLKEKVTRRVALAIALATAGLWLLLGISPGELAGIWDEPSRETVGVLSGLFSGVMYALIIIVTRVYAQSFDAMVMCFFQNLTISLILLPLVGVFPAEALWSFLLMGAVHSTLAPILYFKGMGLVLANRAAILGYAEPVGAIIFGMAFFGEYPTALSLAGGALILYSGYLTLRGDKENA